MKTKEDLTMNYQNNSVILDSGQVQVSEKNKVLRNTYLLLSGTLMFSAMVAGIAVLINMPPVNIWVNLIGSIGLLFIASKFSDRPAGLFWVFALTGFLGLTLGGVVNAYLKFIPNGGQLIATSLFFTGTIFIALSFYAVQSKKDFSFLGGMLMVGIITAFLVGLAAYFFNWPAVSLAVSAVFVLLCSGLILYDTSRIVNGGETNYILATISLYLSIYNLFLNLLHLLTAFSGGDE
ncbi:MAG: Bax inhibitor-1/YccA family protein [Methylacidiphilales bacterium]|nr:Bax inhibitor-1/YccA family protein [Candidatus Methylacidiphilales bacterium]